MTCEEYDAISQRLSRGDCRPDDARALADELALVSARHVACVALLEEVAGSARPVPGGYKLRAADLLRSQGLRPAEDVA